MALRCVVVTPERTQLDQEVRSVVLPMADGQLGVLPGRAPLVGRLGYGILRFETAQGTTNELFVDGGFVQIEKDVVSVLTSRAAAPSSLDAAAAQKALDDALALPGSTPAAQSVRNTALLRARGQLRTAQAKNNS